MACSFAEQPLDGEVNYISGIEPSGIKRERPFQTQLRSTRLSLSAGSPADLSRKPGPDTSQETQAELASAKPRTWVGRAAITSSSRGYVVGS